MPADSDTYHHGQRGFTLSSSTICWLLSSAGRRAQLRQSAPKRRGDVSVSNDSRFARGYLVVDTTIGSHVHRQAGARSYFVGADPSGGASASTFVRGREFFSGGL